MHPLLDNVFWHALTGPHARFAVGDGGARRFAPGFSPIVAFADPQRPDLAALVPHCAVGERFYCAGWSGAAPAGWCVELEASMLCMAWQGETPAEDDAPDAVPLGPAHVAEAMALAELTRPGPFGPRTLELGEYFGCFEGGRLVAMSGERMAAGPLREISGVATHPDAQGRGFARRLMRKLIRRELLRGETPFLHVMGGNAGAVALYRRMGFALAHETVVRVIARA
ncbi:GNAT family N-acetyltransferase [Aquincola sp. MAHUQ-54]|uniref:GNAT family N-acetyltransferase n=1 Tax=Aquincola agrisoli TaxID=3119538 RepID=A0AAW9QHJ4_9BURK